MTARLAAAMNATLQVLVVEDDARYRAMLLTMLRDLRCEPSACAGGREALAMLEESEPDLLLLDLNMPGMHGLEFLEQLRRGGREAPVIILTGVGTLNDAQRAIRLDVSDFLTKPCHLRDLELALDRVRRELSTGKHSSDDDAFDQSPEPPMAEEPRLVSDGAVVPLADLERDAIHAALRRTGDNRSAAAALLGISRRTLHYRLAHYRGREQPGSGG